MHNLALASILF